MEEYSKSSENNIDSSLSPAGKVHYIIGIGASAGGLEAIHEFFDNMPQGSHFSFVIIQHLSPDYKSLMADLLSRHTQMKVTEAEDGMLLRTNSVYVIPNKKFMTLRHGKLRLTEKNNVPGPNNAIDIFMHSLAQEKENCAIAIILSGTGSDGTKGIEAIKKAGGMVIVQDPLTAKFDGMPNSAIASGHADLILPPELMPEEIFNYVRQGALLRALPEEESVAEEAIMQEIFNLVKNRTTFDFSFYKRHTITRRILRRMAFLHIVQLDKYLTYLQGNPEEIDALGKEFLIGVTKFFRDPEAFEVLRKRVIPELVDSKLPNDQLKIWTAACSTGEEAYSMAILIAEYLQSVDKEINVKIFASDVDREAVEFAARGVYDTHIEKDVSEERLEKFFIWEGGKYVVKPHIRKMVIFAHHNVIKDPPYSKIDLVSCRNMLIYMNPILQKKVLFTFHFSLNVGGYLFLGPSENPGELSAAIVDISKKWKIYKNVHQAQNFIFDAQNTPTLQLRKAPIGQRGTESRPAKGLLSEQMAEIFNEAVVEEFGYAGVYIDENYNVLNAIGDYKKFLELPEKKLQFNLLKMVSSELSLTLGIAIRKAIKGNMKVSSKRVRVQTKNKVRYISFTVKPYVTPNDTGQKFIFILFGESKLRNNVVSELATEEKEFTNIELYQDLESELKETKENLQSAVEELETSNEELQSSNEELLSSNEELQSTNEELQSLNEELHTVNTEHQLKIKELVELNDDLNNYFRSTDIGQILIDRNMIIRKYTPAVMKQINVIDSDIGRPIGHFSLNIKYDGLVEDIRAVIQSGDVIEREIEVNDGQFYLMRIMPFIRLDKKSDGVVVTFVDITTLKDLNNILSGVLNSSLSGIMAFKNIRNSAGQIIDFEWIMANEASGHLIKRSPKELVGKRLLVEMPGNLSEGLFDKYVRVAQTGEPLHYEYYYTHEGIRSWFETVAVKMDNGLAVTFADISDKKLAQEKTILAYENLKKAEENLKKLNNELEKRVSERTAALSMSEERFRLVSLATNDAVWDWNLVSNEMWWNEGFRTMFGYQPEEVERGIESWYNRLHPEDRDRVIDGIHEVINSGRNQWSDEYRFMQANGTFSYIFGRGYVLHNENGTPYRMLGSLVDLTKLKQTQEELGKTNENLRRINNDLDNFIYTASHDLKAPIINLEGLVKRLKKELNLEDDNVSFIVELITETVEAFKRTVNSLTEVSKIQKNINEDIEWVGLHDLLHEITLNIRDMIESSEADIMEDFAEVKKIHFSRKNLRSIVYNLLSNAIKYRSPDRKPIIKISTRKIKGYILLCVEDNGLGIEENKLSKMFTMFKRFHDHVDGSGVGLYIVKRILENVGGKIEVESELNQGTAFRIYFPN
jgi:two-component system CheB/CheR fusion protein